MISIFKKFGKLIFNILLIVGIVVLVFLWNPFGIFGDGLKLQNTANVVEEIKNIGQLVTAEYYGEVISTYEDTYLDINNTSLLEEEINDSYIELKDDILSDILQEYYDSEGEKSKKLSLKNRIKSRKLFLDNNTEEILTSIDKISYINNSSHWFVLYLSENEWNFDADIDSYTKIKNDANKSKKHIKDLLNKGLEKEYNKIFKQVAGKSRYDEYSDAGLTNSTSFTEFYANTHRSNETDDGKVKLAIIGRGSVKAGINFGALNDENLVYNKKLKKIYLIGPNVEILDKDINPWFIPEKRIPGYDILLVNRHAKFEHMKKLKSRCIDKLEHQARATGILKQAESNAKEVLISFFSLLTGDEIEEVIFKENTLNTDSKAITEDGIINYDELILIDRMYNQMLGQIGAEKDSALKANYKKQLKKFIDDFQDSTISIKTKLSLSSGVDLQHADSFESKNTNYKSFFNDKIINLDEFILINKHYNQMLNAIKRDTNKTKKENLKVQLEEFLNDIKVDTSLLRIETSFAFNCFNRHIPFLLRDDILTSETVKEIKKLRLTVDTTKSSDLIKGDDPYYWFDEKLEYLSAYNSFIDKIKGKYYIGNDLSVLYNRIDSTNIKDTVFKDTLTVNEKVSIFEDKCKCKGRKEGNYIYGYETIITGLDSLKYPIINDFKTVKKIIWRDKPLNPNSVEFTHKVIDNVYTTNKHEIIAIKEYAQRKSEIYNTGTITKFKRKTKEYRKKIDDNLKLNIQEDYLKKAKSKIKNLKEKIK